jgi:DNA recombination protein RmuC
MIEIFILIGLGLVFLACVGLFLKLQALSHDNTSREAGDKLIEIQALLGQSSQQAELREQGVRAELRSNREELGKAIMQLSETVHRLGKDQSGQQEQFRKTVDDKMKELRTENSQKLDEMRKTVDEKLQTTLERRLSESFKSVSERLEAVQRGLGEMQSLATGVGDLKRVLTNVKTRGTSGEVQLSILIEDVLTPGHYVANYDCGRTGGQQRVEYGIKMPGTDEDVYLPVDAKFPMEDYERLLTAIETADGDAVLNLQKALMARVRGFAKDVAGKYINPPHTTPAAILFLPTEGLYAEVLRNPGFVEGLQRDFAVTVTGPTNFQVLLTTFRMGYQQMAMQEHAAEVWRVLGAVKNEFNRYGEQINAMSKNVRAMEGHIGKLETRKNVMLRALKSVHEVEEGVAQTYLPDEMTEQAKQNED